MATARFLERVVAQRPMPVAPGRRLVDVDLRRGRVRVRRSTAASRRARAPRSSCSRAQWETACPTCGRELKPRRHARGQAADPDLDLRDQQARPRGDVPRHRRGLRDPDGRPALLQRLRPGPGALEPVHRRRGDLRLAPAQRPPAGHLRGRRAVARLHPRLRHRARASCSRSSPTRAVGPRDQPRHRPADHGRRGRAGRSRPGSGLDIEPSPQRAVPRGRHPPLLRRPDAGARAARLRGRRSSFEDGMAELRRAGCRTRRPSTASTTRPRSWPPAAWPARRDA